MTCPGEEDATGIVTCCSTPKSHQDEHTDTGVAFWVFIESPLGVNRAEVVSLPLVVAFPSDLMFVAVHASDGSLCQGAFPSYLS